MNVRELKNAMIRLERHGYKEVEVHMFAHDHDYEAVDQGVGEVVYVDFVEREDGSEIVALHR